MNGEEAQPAKNGDVERTDLGRIRRVDPLWNSCWGGRHQVSSVQKISARKCAPSLEGQTKNAVPCIAPA